MKLNEGLVFSRTKTSSYEYIKQINFYGLALTDISIIRQMPSLEIANFSGNQLKSLEDFASCVHLREIYLSENNVSEFSQIYHLKNLPKLSVLFIRGNPVSKNEEFRRSLISLLPSLTNIDGTEVSPGEKSTALGNWIGQRKMTIYDCPGDFSPTSDDDKNTAQVQQEIDEKVEQSHSQARSKIQNHSQAPIIPQPSQNLGFVAIPAAVERKPLKKSKQVQKKSFQQQQLEKDKNKADDLHFSVGAPKLTKSQLEGVVTSMIHSTEKKPKDPKIKNKITMKKDKDKDKADESFDRRDLEMQMAYLEKEYSFEFEMVKERMKNQMSIEQSEQSGASGDAQAKFSPRPRIH